MTKPIATRWFSPAVPVRTNQGFRYNVNSVEGAARELLEWKKRGPKWNQAVRVCMAGLANEMTPAQVREAFLAAAIEENRLLPPIKDN